MFWKELNHNQEIEMLEDIYELNGYSICNDKYNQVFITGNQFKNDLELIAKAGDICRWDKVEGKLKFTNTYTKFDGFDNIPFGAEEEKIINQNIFKVLQN